MIYHTVKPLILLLLWTIVQVASAETYYVNNLAGDDTNAGTSSDLPLKTIAKAISLSNTSDTISLAKTEQPYQESIVLTRLGGTPGKPFIIEGNGAVLNGLKPIPAQNWTPVSGNLYLNKKDKFPYGLPYLVQQKQRVSSARSIDSIEAEQFFWDPEQGIFFRTAEGKSPADYELKGTLLSSGLQANSSSYFVCRNLICEYFSNDGFNIHGDCRGVRLDNVVARHNGDDGISIHESGGLVVFNAHVHHNTYGIQDVNASRSMYHGVLAEFNRVGVSLVGGFHSVEDSIIRNNRQEIAIASAVPKHLIGGQFLATGKTTLVVQNALIQGNRKNSAVSIGNDSHAIIRNSVIEGGKIGLNVHRLGFAHISRCLITDCQTELSAKPGRFFADYNIYSTGAFLLDSQAFNKDQWDAYREKTELDTHSRIGAATVDSTGKVTIAKDSAAYSVDKPVGPTQPIHLVHPTE